MTNYYFCIIVTFQLLLTIIIMLGRAEEVKETIKSPHVLLSAEERASLCKALDADPSLADSPDDVVTVIQRLRKQLRVTN